MDNYCISDDKFKAKFKYYKSKKPKPTLEGVLSDNNPRQKVIPLTSNYTEDPRALLLGLQPQFSWSSYTFEDHPGLILISNPFTSAGQKYWIRQCLENYPRKPNKKNLDFEMEVADWWNECHRDGNCNKVLQKKLRWTTLGYHHDWDTKLYTEENQSPFPEDLAKLSDVVATYLGFTFKAEAAIVNYYHMDSTLAPHTDHSECNLDAPLLSFSFGQSAIFLIGGQDKSTEPSAILLQSGDIVVMSKEARLCYHAVPKILPAEFMPWIEDIQQKRDKEVIFDKYCDSIEGTLENNSKIENISGTSILHEETNEKTDHNVERNVNKNSLTISDTKINKLTESVCSVKDETNLSNTNRTEFILSEMITQIEEKFTNDGGKVSKNLDSENSISKNLTEYVHRNPCKEFYDTSKHVRLKYLKDSQAQNLMNSSHLEEKWQDFSNYLQESRINMNVRQVLNDNQKCLNDVLLH